MPNEPRSDPAVVAALVDNHRRFLAFLERRLRSRAEAEDILQAAFVKGIERGGAIRDRESAVAWFYRLLRNALVDHYRRSAAENRRNADEKAADSATEETALKGEICACLRSLLPALKPEYAEMIERVDLLEEPLADVAAVLGITPINAGVRLHRARTTLKKQLERSCGTCATHGCLDCRCPASPGGPRSSPAR